MRIAGRSKCASTPRVVCALQYGSKPGRRLPSSPASANPTAGPALPSRPAHNPDPPYEDGTGNHVGSDDGNPSVGRLTGDTTASGAIEFRRRSRRAVAVGGQRGHSPPPASAGDSRSVATRSKLACHLTVGQASPAEPPQTPLRSPSGTALTRPSRASSPALATPASKTRGQPADPSLLDPRPAPVRLGRATVGSILRHALQVALAHAQKCAVEKGRARTLGSACFVGAGWASRRQVVCPAEEEPQGGKRVKVTA